MGMKEFTDELARAMATCDRSDKLDREKVVGRVTLRHMPAIMPEHGGGGEAVALTLGQRAVAADLLRCCESWEPNVCVMGNVRAKDAADLLRHFLTTPPTPSAPDSTFAEWLAHKMPAGTVIGDPAWWADRIARQYAKRCTPPSAPVVDDAMVERAAVAIHDYGRELTFRGPWDNFFPDYQDRVRGQARAALAAALSGVSAPMGVQDAARRVVSFLDHANLDTSLLPDDMGDALRSLRAALTPPAAAPRVEGDAR